jgi:hypothetical protein
MAGHDVDFAIPRPVPAFENCVPATVQFRARDVFTENAERLARVV